MAIILLGILCIGVPSSSQTSKIAFSTGDGLYVVDSAPDATPFHLTDRLTTDAPVDGIPIHPGSFDWSPDGKQIVFLHYDTVTNPTDIWIINSDGSNPRELRRRPKYENTTRSYYDPVWSPDGSRIAFVDRLHISIINSDGTGYVQLYTPAGNLDWSPGGQFVYTYKGHVGILNSDGTDRQILLSSDQWYSDIQVSPDGNKLVLPKGYEEIWLMGIDGSDLRYLTDGLNPTWSPDSRRIAFNRKDEEQLFLIDADGSNFQVLLDFPAWEPSWSPWLSDETAITPISWGQVKRAN